MNHCEKFTASKDVTVGLQTKLTYVVEEKKKL